MLSAFVFSVFMLNTVMLNIVMLGSVMLNVIMLSSVMLNVFTLNVVMLSTVRPIQLKIICKKEWFVSQQHTSLLGDRINYLGNMF
jgi:hypothetical protein